MFFSLVAKGNLVLDQLRFNPALHRVFTLVENTLLFAVSKRGLELETVLLQAYNKCWNFRANLIFPALILLTS
jgi:hypothetical protein